MMKLFLAMSLALILCTSSAFAMGRKPLGGNDRVHLTVTGQFAAESEFDQDANGGQFHAAFSGQGIEALYKGNTQTDQRGNLVDIDFYVTGLASLVPSASNTLLNEIRDCVEMFNGMPLHPGLTYQADVQMDPGGDDLTWGGLGGNAVLIQVPAQGNFVHSVGCFYE